VAPGQASQQIKSVKQTDSKGKLCHMWFSRAIPKRGPSHCWYEESSEGA
jgi:hypothetical protein